MKIVETSAGRFRGSVGDDSGEGDDGDDQNRQPGDDEQEDDRRFFEPTRFVPDRPRRPIDGPSDPLDGSRHDTPTASGVIFPIGWTNGPLLRFRLNRNIQ